MLKLDLSKVSRADKIKFAVFVIVLVGLFASSIPLMPTFKGLIDPATRTTIVEEIRSQGPWGVLILLGMQLLQVIVALIPGEAVQVVAGVLYGGLGGWLICIIGLALSSSLIFALVAKLGMPFVHAMITEKQADRLAFLKANKKLDIVVFILFFIPGMPKDVFTYVVPVTEMTLPRFLTISLIARTPALIASTFAGAAFTEGDYTTMVAIFVVCGLLGVLGIVFNDRILAFFSRKHQEREEELGDQALAELAEVEALIPFEAIGPESEDIPALEDNSSFKNGHDHEASG